MPRQLMDEFGFLDATALLRPGIFVLVERGRPVYIGRADGHMVEQIIALRPSERLPWLPRIEYDQIFVKQVHPDRIRKEYAELIKHYQPRHNLKLCRPEIKVVEPVP